MSIWKSKHVLTASLKAPILVLLSYIADYSAENEALSA